MHAHFKGGKHTIPLTAGGVQVGSLHPKAFLTNKTWGGSQEAPPQQHSSWDSAVGMWTPNGQTLCRLGTQMMTQGHQVWRKSAQKWCPAKMKPHPKLKVRVAVSKTDYKL